MSRIDTICAGLLSTLPLTTAAAVVQWAGTEREQRLVTTLGRLAADANAAGLGSPAVILVGNAIGEAEAFCATDARHEDLAHAA
jgi:uroporphyrin-III C-methyltransferase